MDEIDVEYFPVWRRYLQQIRAADLTEKELGALTRAMMEYQFEGKKPDFPCGKLPIFWVFIQDDLDHARKRYETAVINGRKGGRKKKVQPEETRQNPEEGISITESISVTESISESRSDTKKVQAAASASAEENLSVSKRVYGQYGWVLLTDADYDRLREEMGDAELQACIAYIDASAQSTGNRNHWMDWCAVLRRCYQNGWHQSSGRYPKKEEIPKGASGILGDAELEAIRRVLAT